MKVWVTTVQHRHGTDVLGVFERREDAYDVLLGYVETYWNEAAYSAHQEDLIDKMNEVDDALSVYFGDLAPDEDFDVDQVEFFPAKSENVLV